jgi:5-formyltetrahydrofolate cyclo-ligase
LTSGDEKRALRAELVPARARLSAADRAARSRAIANRLDLLDLFASARTLAAYAPLGAEVDCREAARRALARGGRVLYPRAIRGERILAFAACAESALVPGDLGAGEPPASCEAVPLDEIDCVLLPGVAFSTDGVRLGRGAGFYDATLARMPRAARVGLAFDLQIVPSLPREAHDALLDALVSEARTLRFARDSG